MKSRVQLYGITGKYVVIDTEATKGAVVGSTLLWPDGTVVTVEDLTKGPSSSSGPGTTDELEEGQFNKYFSAKLAQDAVGAILEDSASIAFTYDVDAPSISADLKPTGVEAGTYGDGVKLLLVAVDADGRLTAVSEKALIAGNGISFDIDPDTGAITISVNSFVATSRITRDGNTRVTRNGDIRVTR